MMQRSRITQSGNVLFIILIAVALFAALSLAVSQMMQGTPHGITEETDELAASEILDYARTVKQVIQDLRISNGCDEGDISFENEAVSGYEHGAPNSCRVFDPEGGGFSWITPPEGVNDGSDWVFVTLPVYGIPDESADEPELLMVLPRIEKSLCKKINKALGVNAEEKYAPPQEADNNSELGERLFDGASAYGFTLPPLGGDPKTLNRQATACFEDRTTGNYFFYHVLIPR